MVSALWKAASEGNLESVLQLLRDASSVDIEIKDHTGATPLIEAIKNGHLEVVRALLDKGADPANRSSQGLPEQYTSEPSILDLLRTAQTKVPMNGAATPDAEYVQDVPAEQGQSTFQQSTESYTYYPTLNSPPPLPEGAVYYPTPPPSQPMADGQTQSDARNLPPPDIARCIPCRYFPACRYGASCMFLHPQGPYFSGPLPAPAQYPAPYDPMVSPPYQPNYYVSQPGYQPPNGASVSPPSAPLPPMIHTRTTSEVVSPLQGPFTPQTAPPALPYGPMSPIPTAYHTGQAPMPMSIPPLPPAHPQAMPPPPGPQSPPSMYSGPHQVPPYGIRPDAAGQYSAPNTVPPLQASLVNGMPNAQMPPPGPDAYPHRDPIHPRRGNTRRPSLAGRKPPCFFFPAGRCKNGDECRFPHVMPELPAPPAHPSHAGRGGRPRQVNGTNGTNATNGYHGLEERFANFGLRDDLRPRAPNGVDSTRPPHNDAGGRPRFNGLKTNQSAVNGPRDRRQATKSAPQRLPNADDFPVLAGSTTPPSRSPGLNGTVNGFSGPTAAQVLQSPAPFRRDSTRESSTRGQSPDSAKGAKDVDPNGVATAETTPESSPAPAASVPAPVVNKLPISFAAVANQVPVSA